MELNKHILILAQENDFLILKTDNTDKIIKLSKLEWEIINDYSISKNYSTVIENFKNRVEIQENTLDILIQKAVESNIINCGKNIKGISRFRFIFKRNRKIFEIASIDLTNTWIEKQLEKKTILYILFLILGLSTIYFLFEIFKTPLNFRNNYFETLYKVPITIFSLIKYIYLASFLSVCFHELGHYLLYKYFGGKTTVFGLGLLFFFLPAFYNKAIMSLIKSKKKRNFINTGGILFDVLSIFFILYFTKNYHLDFPIISFLCYSIMISIVIRSFFNLNIFLPGSDGYFVFAEIINKPDLSAQSIRTFKSVIQNKSMGKKDVGYFFYALFSFITIGFSWLFIFSPFFIYFYAVFQ